MDTTNNISSNLRERWDYYDPIESSIELNELFDALSKAQGEMEEAKTDSKNPFFKSNYADLASIIRASRKVLAKHGLSVIQPVRTFQDKRYLFTRLGHSSGQWIEGGIPLCPPKEDIQSLGSYITYLRRYCYAAMVGVVSSGEDDDGEKAMDRKTIDKMVYCERQKV